MKHRLTLDYELGEGALRPFLEGLSKGVAYAGQCLQCGRVTFPPEKVCSCRQAGQEHSSSGWKTLSGRGTIIHSTTGRGGGFALVRFDGADNMAVCRIADTAGEGDRVSLSVSGPQRPAMTVQVLSLEDEGEDIETID